MAVVKNWKCPVQPATASRIGGVRRETLAGTMIPAPEIGDAGADCGWPSRSGRRKKERCASPFVWSVCVVKFWIQRLGYASYHSNNTGAAAHSHLYECCYSTLRAPAILPVLYPHPRSKGDFVASRPRQLLFHSKFFSSGLSPMGTPQTDNSSDLEKSDELAGIVKVDPHGLPLVPQPSDFKDDPLVRSRLSQL